MNKKIKNADLERLQLVVGAYGAEPLRWPDADRRDLAALARQQTDAPWMRAAAETDAMLDFRAGADRLPVAAEAILAAARATRQSPARTVAANAAGRRPAPRHRIGNWPSAALLAASLLVGIWAGANGAVEYLLPGSVGDVLMTLNASEDESNFFGLFDTGPAPAGEDVL